MICIHNYTIYIMKWNYTYSHMKRCNKCEHIKFKKHNEIFFRKIVDEI